MKTRRKIFSSLLALSLMAGAVVSSLVTHAEECDIQKPKVVFVGDAGVGKTSVINRIVNRKYYRDVATTVGSSYFSAALGRDEFGVNIWDTAGQEKFQAFIPIFIRNADVVVVMCDVVDRNSFNHVSVWKQLASERARPGARYIFVANKTDISNWQISDNEITQKGKLLGFIETVLVSAKTGEDIECLEQVIARAAKENIGIETPPSYENRLQRGLQVSDEESAVARKKGCC